MHRHNLLRDVFADSCRLAHLSVKVEVGNNLTPDHDHSRPAKCSYPQLVSRQASSI